MPVRQPQQTQLVIETRPDPRDFVFARNPESVDYDRAAQYADVPIALDEAGPASTGLATQWTRNQPETIRVDFVLYEEREDRDVEEDLKKLDALMNKDPRTGEPSDLLFVHGVRTDRVRLTSKSVKDMKKYTPDGRRQHVRVNLTLRVLRQRL